MKIHESVRTRWLFLINLPHRILHPPARALARIVCFAVLLFILYFQFFYGPFWATCFVLGVTAYSATALWLFFAGKLAEITDNPAAHPRLAALASRADLRNAAVFWASAALHLAHCLIYLFMAKLERSSWFAVLALYSVILFAIHVCCAGEMQRAVHSPESAQKRERYMTRILSVLLLLISLAFVGISIETVFRNEAKRWPAFVLAFQILFTLIRLLLYGLDAFRSRHSGNTILRMTKDVNLVVVLVAVYTTQTAFLARFSSDMLLRLSLNIMSSLILFIFIMRITVGAVLRAFGSEAQKT